MTDKIANVDIVVYALYQLGGAARAVDNEEVGLRCWELFPERFSWMKFPRYPDKDAARKRLHDARSDSHGGLVRGNDRRGWRLTAAGVDRAREVEASMGRTGVNGDLRLSDHQEGQRFLNELERRSAFRKFALGGNSDKVEWHEFTDFLRCPVDTSRAKLRDRLETYRATAQQAGRSEILRFLADCERKFHDRFGK